MKVFVAVPCMDQMDTGFVRSMINLRKPEGVDLAVEFMECSLVYLSRERLAQIAIGMESDYTLWLDSDMIFNPDLLEKLLEDAKEGRDFVSGLCFRRRPDYNPAIWKRIRLGLPGEAEVEEYDDYPPDAIFEIDGSGMAAVLVKTDLMNTIYERDKQIFLPISGYGEDVSFCIRAKKAGCRLWCDSRIKVGHQARTVVTEETFRAYNAKKAGAGNGDAG